MLFTHIFYAPASNWIWAINLILFLACVSAFSSSGAGATRAPSPFTPSGSSVFLVSQLSPVYGSYMRICLNALELPQNYPGLDLLRFPQWISALTTAMPTVLLIAGLFYYRRSFLKAVAESTKH